MDLIKYEDPSCNSEPDPTCADEDEKCKNSASSCVSTLTDTVEELESIVRRSYTAADSVATSCEGYQAKVTEHGLDIPSSEDRSDEFSEANTDWEATNMCTRQTLRGDRRQRASN